MLARGINVALGTDSCASSPNLNLLDDLRLVHHLCPAEEVHALWQMVTIRAARAIRREQEIGSLAPGMQADFVVFSSDGLNPLRDILTSPTLPSQVWIGGGLIAQEVS
jgi:cytosine/adenosine deaminase-related metal-dependent hydrolase